MILFTNDLHLKIYVISLFLAAEGIQKVNDGVEGISSVCLFVAKY